MAGRKNGWGLVGEWEGVVARRMKEWKDGRLEGGMGEERMGGSSGGGRGEPGTPGPRPWARDPGPGALRPWVPRPGRISLHYVHDFLLFNITVHAYLFLCLLLVALLIGPLP